MTRCSGVVILHENGTATCSEPACCAGEILEAVVAAHAKFVPCLAVAKVCPMCAPDTGAVATEPGTGLPLPASGPVPGIWWRDDQGDGY